MKNFLALLMLALPLTVTAATPSPYAGQETRQIKALSADERENLLAGRGMGFAMAAELNGYPGPAHVLELSRELGLNADQRSKTDTLYKYMERRAKNFGRQLVDAEQALDVLFASKRITPVLLTEALTRIGELQSRVRAAHLEAHLEQTRILTPEQIALYIKLRGYAAAAPAAGAGHQHKH